MVRQKIEKLIRECLKLTHGEADSKSGAIVVIYYPFPINPEVEKKEEDITDQKSMSIKHLQEKVEMANYAAERFKKEANSCQIELNKAVTQIRELHRELIKCKQNQRKSRTNQE